MRFCFGGSASHLEVSIPLFLSGYRFKFSVFISRCDFVLWDWIRDGGSVSRLEASILMINSFIFFSSLSGNRFKFVFTWLKETLVESVEGGDGDCDSDD